MSPLEGEQAEADAAQLELAQERPRTAAHACSGCGDARATSAPSFGGHLDGLCHGLVPEGHSEVLQKRASLFVGRAVVTKVMFIPFGLSSFS